MLVKFIAANIIKEQINWGSHQDPKGILEVGKEYEIERAEVHSSYTKIFLKDFPKLSFNSVWFNWSDTNDIFELPGTDKNEWY